jgi:DNA-binding FadR family transcriptional regulator
MARRQPGAGNSAYALQMSASLTVNGEFQRGKMAEQLARRIEERVAEMGWPVGLVIGSETQLLEEYGVSRAVLREAIRLVEHHNVAVMKRGPGGGLVVTEPDVGSVTRAIAIYLERQGVQVVHLFDARVAVEMQALEHATSNLTEGGIRELRAALAAEEAYIDALKRGEEVTSAPVHGVHELLVRFSGNPAMALFVESLIELTRGHASTEFSGDRQIPAARDLHYAHEKIVEAVTAGDAALAQHRMLRHLSAMRSWLT